MVLKILFSAGPRDWDDYHSSLRAAFAAEGIAVELTRDESDPGGIDFVIWSPSSPLQDFAPFTGLKAVLNLWAGVERAVGNQTITVPLCRMVDPGLTEGMAEWVTAHVLRHHLGIDRHILQQDGVWRHDHIPPLARNRHVGILGLGELGSACAKSLAALGFQVAGWSRREKSVPGITCQHGDARLRDVLATSEILVTLLPLTPDTENLLNAERLALLPESAFVINPGRGRLIDDAALLAALESGRLAHATLDVFRQEPLPPEHPFWAHPKITVTPHVAAETRPQTASQTVAANIRRWLDGRPLLHVVDRASGY